MTEKQLRELDAWIHRHVFEADLFVGLKKRDLWYRPDAKGYTDRQSEAGRYTRAEAKKHEYPHDDPVTIHEFEPEHYTTDSDAALEVLKKLIFADDIVLYETVNGEIGVRSDLSDLAESAPTVELAICLFAKKLFEK